MPTPSRESLTDGTITIRRLQLEDRLPRLEASIESRAELEPWMPWARDLSPDMMATFVAGCWLGWNDGTAYEFVIEDAETGRDLGGVAINDISKADRSANIGYWVRSDASGRGVATRATRLAARFAFEEAGLRRLQLYHAAGNPASGRVAQKVGFRPEGTRRRYMLIYDEEHDAVFYALCDASEITEG